MDTNEVGINSELETNNNSVSNINISLEDNDDYTMKLASNIGEFLNTITKTLKLAPRNEPSINYHLLKYMGAFDQDFNRLLRCDDIVKYINDLTTYMSFETDSIPSNIQDMISDEEMDRLNIFKELSFKSPSIFENENIQFIPLIGVKIGKSLIFRKFSDGYYQGTLSLFLT